MADSIETYVVDSFTETVFKGNPAGVCLLQKELSEKLMLQIANELGYSETAFLKKVDGSNEYSIRYFSPKMEIPLCGHATLASSKILFQKYHQLTSIKFITTENLTLNVERAGEMIQMEFPVYQTIPADCSTTVLTALGIDSYINCEYNKETNILLLQIESSEVLRGLKPDFQALLNAHDSINGVLVTAASKTLEFDFESRYFWPWSGTNEDPVTGGTHTFLAKYWSSRLNKTRMRSFQCSERTGLMEVELKDNQLFIYGKAQIVLEGKLFTQNNSCP